MRSIFCCKKMQSFVCWVHYLLGARLVDNKQRDWENAVQTFSLRGGVCRGLGAVAFLFAAGLVNAAWPPVISIDEGGNSTDGSYTVTVNATPIAKHVHGNYFGDEPYNSYALYERVNGGSWLSLGNTASITRSKGNGIYEYKADVWRYRTGHQYRFFTTEWHYTVFDSTASTAIAGVTVTKTPGTPGTVGFSPSALSCSSNFTVSWGAASGGNRYQIQERKRRAGGSWSAWSTLASDVSGLSYARNGLATGYEYQYAIRSRYYLNGHYGHWSGFRYSGNLYKPYCAPGTPGVASFSTVSPTTVSSYTVSWPAASGTVTSYELQEQFNGGSWSTVQNASSRSKTFSNRARGNFCYRTRASNADASGSYSASRCVLVKYAAPGLPGTATHTPATPLTTGSYTVSWSSASGVVTSYELQERLNSGTWSTVQNTSSQHRVFSGRARGTYCYRVRAINADTQGSYTGEHCFVVRYRAPGTPSTPSYSPSAPSTTSSYTVAWSPASGTVSQYELQEQFEGGGWSTVQNSGALNKTFSNRDRGNYCYRVRASNVDNSSSYSTSLCLFVQYAASGAPGTPSLSTLTPVTTGSYSVSWAAASGTVSSYELQEQFNGGSWSTTQNSSARSQSFSNRSRGNYCYRVRAHNVDNASAYTATTCATVSYPVPGDPGAIQTTSGPDHQGNVSLSWSAGTGTISRYTLEQRGPDGGAWSVVQDTAATSATLLLSASGAYDYRVKACNVDNCSAYTPLKTLGIALYEPPVNPPAASVATAPDSSVSDRIGSVSGQFRVNESGAATYSIPLTLAAGTAGVAPQLSLNYSSQGGNGLLGKGWSLSGVSAITRCRQTLGQDGQARPISWSDTDRFCLDGQRLVVTNGSYGSVGATYKTEIDSFVTVTSVGGSAGHPASFTVRRKDGSISQYGNTINARLSPGAHVLTWAQNRFQDSVGNAIDYVYTTDNHGQRLSQVLYAYGAGSQAQAKVEFNYTSRADASGAYVGGYELNITERLSQIQVLDGGDQPLRRYQLSYRDQLSDTSTEPHQLSLLANIEECAGAICLPATELTWGHQVAPTFSGNSEVLLRTGRDRSLGGYRHGDVNGDGLPDLIWLEADWDNDGRIHDQEFKYALGNGNGYAAPITSYVSSSVVDKAFTWEVLDYNADGRQDLAVMVASHWQVFLSKPHNNGEWRLASVPLNTGVSLTTFSNSNVDSDRKSDALFVDLDADGLADILDVTDRRLLVKDSSQPIGSDHLYHYTGAQAISWQQSGGGYGDWPTHFARNAVGDFNGDGRLDVLAIKVPIDVGYAFGKITERYNYRDPISLTVFTTSGDGTRFERFADLPGFTFTSSTGDTLPDEENTAYWQRYYAADFNGDGLSDLVYKAFNENQEHYYYQLSTGTGFTTAVALTGDITYARQLQMVDYNRDGSTDIVWSNARGEMFVRLWQNGQFTGDNRITVPDGVLTTEATDCRNYLYFSQPMYDECIANSPPGNVNQANLLLDADGDGGLDLVSVQTQMYDTYLSSYTGDAGAPFAITDITDGLGATTTISYGTLVDSGHYERQKVAGTPRTRTVEAVGYGAVYSYSYEFPYIDYALFYENLNGQWPLPAGSQTLGKDKPVLEVMAPISVVTMVQSSAPAAGVNPNSVDANATSAISYYYGEMKLQAAGRGSLGFHKIMSVDEQSGIKTTTTYRQDFPYIGYPLHTEVVSADDRLLSRAENTWELENWNNGNPVAPYRPVLTRSVEASYNLVDNGATQGALLSTTTTNTHYDDYNNDGSSDSGSYYGNPTWIEVVVADGSGAEVSRKTTVNEYNGNEYQNVALSRERGRLSRTRVTTTRGSDTQTRTSAFTYYSSGATQGLLRTEVIEPDNPAYTLTTTYLYDSFGNKETVTQSGTGVTSRSTKTSYDLATGRYPETVENSYGQITEQVTSRNLFGQPTHVSDINGVVSTISYGALGRKVQETNTTGAFSQTLLANCDSSCPSSSAYMAITSKAGGAQSIRYVDVLGREIRSATQTFSGGWAYVDTEYDTLGRIKRKSEPHSGTAQYWSEFEYDILGRVISTTLPGVSTPVIVSYDGLTTITTNPAGQARTEVKNVLGELVQVIDNISGRLSYRYDAQGNLSAVTNHGNGDVSAATVQLCYDVLGRKTAMRDPDKGGHVSGASASCPTSTTQAATGWWVYHYNVFGELVQQIDAKAQRTTMVYDALGRMTNRVNYTATNTTEGNATWVYNNAGTGLGRGALATVQDSISGYYKVIGYDNYGRVSETVTSLSMGDDHYEKVTYDQYGRTFQVFDAAGDGSWQDSAIENRYNSYGYLSEVVDAVRVAGQARTHYYQVKAMDLRGNVTEALQGNGVTTHSYYHPATGRIETLRSEFAAGIGDIQDHHYTWDEIGNLISRSDRSGNKDLHETFSYDTLNRLTGSQVTGNSAQTVQYNSIGNITYKSDVGVYSYAHNAGPHALTSTSDGVNYFYDANGNMTSDSSGRSLSYSTFDKPTLISKGSHTTTFNYGPDRARYKRTDTNSSGTTVTRYIGSVEKISLPDGKSQIKRYLPGNVLVTLSVDNAGDLSGEQTQYLYKDHLGSIDVITNAVGAIEQALSFDAWGQRRSAVDWRALALVSQFSFDHSLTTRGFTGHEMLDEVGLVHMNGRVYDARLARFVQADPFVDGASSTQGYNRYSYVHNNPLNATDPTGHFAFSLLAGALLVAEGASIGMAFGAMFAAGTMDALVAGASFGEALKAGLISGVAAAAFTGVGQYFQGLSAEYCAPGLYQFGGNTLTMGQIIGQVSAHAALGGVMSALQGGKFGHGFVSAGVTKGVLGALGGGGFVERLALHAVVGGTVSDSTGGKFANGAATAAFAAIVSAGVNSLSREKGGGIELYEEGENIEYSYEERMKLKAALNTQADELDALLTSAKSGDEVALQRLKNVYGSNVDLDVLSERLSRLTSAARSYKSWSIRKLTSSDKNYGSSTTTRAYHTFERGTSRIYLSKTAFNDIMAGNSGSYTLLHEVAHSIHYSHNHDNRSYNFQQVLCKGGC